MGELVFVVEGTTPMVGSWLALVPGVEELVLEFVLGAMEMELEVEEFR